MLKKLKIPDNRKSVLLYLGVPCFIFFIAIGAMAPRKAKWKQVSKEVEIKKEKKDNIPQPIIETIEEKRPAKIVKHIPGITPVDIYGNFEKIGFETKKDIAADGSFFYSDFSEKGMDNHVITYCENGVTNVTTVRLSVTRMLPQYNKVTDMKAFLKYGCSIPYDGADVEKIKNFIEGNYYKNKSSIVISGVRFTLYVPTEFARMINIEKE